MKDTIYTIPLTDAFNAQDECPFCYIHRKLEEDAISFILGSAYMEDDIRADTDKTGFCKTHYKKMYDYGNCLGTALILHTHYIALQKELTEKINAFVPNKTSLLNKLKKPKNLQEINDNILSKWVNSHNHSCYICDYIDRNFIRYLDTFFHLYKSQPEFKKLFNESKGFCLTHFGDLMHLSETRLQEKDKPEFYETLFNLTKANLKRIEEDLSWFIDKYDYKNKDADWKNSKDAIPRGIQKLVGGYVQDPPFKEK